MHRRKCLVIAGRESTEPEIRGWMEEALREHLKMGGLWRVGSVGDHGPGVRNRHSDLLPAL